MPKGGGAGGGGWLGSHEAEPHGTRQGISKGGGVGGGGWLGSHEAEPHGTRQGISPVMPGLSGCTLVEQMIEVKNVEVEKL